MSEKGIPWTLRVLRVTARPSFWLILVLLALITLVHYEEAIALPRFLTTILEDLGLTRHAFERVLYLAPIVWAGFLYSWRGAFLTSIITLACMLPRVLLISQYPVDALFETVTVFIIGNVLAVSFHLLRKERDQRIELQKTQHELALSEQRYRGLFENAQEAIWVHDLNNNILTANEAMAKMTGYERDRLIGMNIAELFSEEALALTKDIQQRLLAGEKTDGSYDQKIFRESGAEAYLRLSTSLVIRDGEPVAFQNTARDITEQKAAEEALRKITDGSPVPTFVINREHVVTHWNTALEFLSGVSSGQVIGTDQAWKAFYPEQRPMMAEFIIDGVSDEEIKRHYGESCQKSRLIDGAYEGEEFFPVLSGDGTWLHFTASPVRDRGGEIISAIETLQDITEQKRAQESLRYYLKQITNAQEEERKRIARELHDETVQDLVVLSRELDVLASNDDDFPEKYRQQLEKLWEQTTGIMQDVRRMSQDLRPAALDRLGLLATLEWLASDAASYSGLDIKVHKSGEERELTEEVEQMLFRITQEALRNAWRHAKATTADITIDFSQAKTRITVKDNGVGFEIPPVMSDFSRHGKLGLAGMQERAQLIGGTLYIDSRPGQGTSITVEV